MSKLERKWGSILMVGAVCPIGVIDCDQLLEKASLFNVQSLPTNQSVVQIQSFEHSQFSKERKGPLHLIGYGDLHHNSRV